MNKKKKNIFGKVLVVLFIIYFALYIASESGYYESKIRESVTITENGIKEFEEKIQNGEEIDINSFLKTERIDYTSPLSNLGETVVIGIESVVTKGFKVTKNILKSLF